VLAVRLVGVATNQRKTPEPLSSTRVLEFLAFGLPSQFEPLGLDVFAGSGHNRVGWTWWNLRRCWIFDARFWNVDVRLRRRWIALRHIWCIGNFDPRKSGNRRRNGRWRNDRWVQLWNDQPEGWRRKDRGLVCETMLRCHGDDLPERWLEDGILAQNTNNG
jgi:hypothetical protein